MLQCDLNQKLFDMYIIICVRILKSSSWASEKVQNNFLFNLINV